jgi:hypothetical protein
MTGGGLIWEAQSSVVKSDKSAVPPASSSAPAQPVVPQPQPQQSPQPAEIPQASSSSIPAYGATAPVARGITGTLYSLQLSMTGAQRDFGDAKKLLHYFFTRDGWSESSLSSRYYRAPQKLTTAQIFFPILSSDLIPSRFGVRAPGKLDRWLIHYKDVVKAPFSGKFRFVGLANDNMSVRWNGKVVLDTGYYLLTQGTENFSGMNRPSSLGVSDRFPHTMGRLPMRAGPWIEIRAGQTYTIETTISEFGDKTYAFLLFELADAQRYRGDGKLRLVRFADAPLPAELSNLPRDNAPDNVDMTGGGFIWATQSSASR